MTRMVAWTRMLAVAGVLAVAMALPGQAGAQQSAQLERGYEAFDQGNYSQAVQAWQPLAEDGIAEAQFMMATLYDHGYGVTRDYAEAERLFMAAAEQDYEQAYLVLGLLYFYGQEADAGSIEQDKEEAARWLRRAGYAGYPRAQAMLAHMYYAGDGVAMNMVESCYWANEAAEQGVAEGQFIAGLLYGNGEGCDMDRIEALKWFELAADQRYPGAALNVDLLEQELEPSDVQEGIDRANSFVPVS